MGSKDDPPKYENFLFSASEELSTNNQSIVEQMDELEARVEKLRASAFEVEEQQTQLTKALTDISESSSKSALTAGHREEIEININRIMQRLTTVNVKVEILRTNEQEQAYVKVKQLLEDLRSQVNSGLENYGKVLESYINACSSEQNGPVNSKFQQVVLSCTLDDQKQVKRILKNWQAVFGELQKRYMQECAEKSTLP